ncbi:family 1 glycosylhydrolase [uncultured Sphingomonas sp.]|uniref:family 1 glycosylhydrolase n=1 Tax=uncultured Sphingomonas sp. TaxID=158754 RepID=UPI0025E1057B|nr:family 1 glycosylhydrolase [uncultured Sphingomonas sp.]
MTEPTEHQTPLQLWGGVECTVVRIGDEFRDEVVLTGHAHRLADLDAIAELGIKTVRYPIVWERVAPDHPDELNWAWHDERLRRLRDLGIRIIGGLVHHGSGPRYTSLLDPEFPAKLARYARAAAERYPFVEMWTPVNEPLTTARFSCLYGHWYPHTRDWGKFIQALAHECRGTLTAMRAIREVNPAALLVATEDLGRTFSTRKLAHQAAHENERRWLSLDLLAGRVGAGHPFRATLERHSTADLLDDLASGDATPDIIGINHYLTSERYLDERVERYPQVDPGSNGRETYADVEAIRIPHLAAKVGPAERLREAWERYNIPLAVTEVHHGCTREEQVRWFKQVWNAARQVREEGVDIRAVTLWSLFGAVDWRSLLTREENHYDVGAFDTRGGKPRPTLIAKTAAALGAGEECAHPIDLGRGWWRRPERFYIGARMSTDRMLGGRPLLVTGATGTLGQAFGRLCHHRGLARVLTDRRAMDITDAASIDRALDEYQPWAVVNTAGFVRVPEAEHQPDDCFRINTTGPELLAAACARRGIPLVTFSSDLVFDGQLGRAYIEADPTSPACVYGQSKADAEDRVLAINPTALIVRTSSFFGPWDRYNFLWGTLDRLVKGEEVHASDNAVVSPTYVPDLVHATLDLLLDGESGLWHLANQGSISWHGLARQIADRGGQNLTLVRDIGGDKADTTLASSRGHLLRPLDHALDDFMLHAEDLPGR